MNHEDWDTYVIPPNFIEGGTLLGGLFKTRNVIEAGILALLVGIPVLGLNLSLTTRVIILCVTALPPHFFRYFSHFSATAAFSPERGSRSQRVPGGDSSDSQKSSAAMRRRKRHPKAVRFPGAGFVTR